MVQIMFCGNCGKEINGNQKFCPFCGAEQKAVILSSPSEPTIDSTTISVNQEPENVSVPVTETPVSVTAENSQEVSTSQTSVSENSVSENAQTIPTQSVPVNQTVNAVPTPNTIPTNNIGVSAVNSAYTPENTASVLANPVVKTKGTEKPERKYSLKHIVLCLVVAGVMAIAAGIFAGLYFTAIA